jgi:hypothetical protein
MKKADIIAATLQELSQREEKLAIESVDFPTYIRQVIDELERKLADIQPDIDIPTCEDFAHLGVECCAVCHVDYPEFELAIVEIEYGGGGWLCCSLDRALNPTKRAAIEQSLEWKELVGLFSDAPERTA